MHCLGCNKILNDSEASLKYEGSEHYKNPEDRYINLCVKCLDKSGLTHYDSKVDTYYDKPNDSIDELEF